MNEESIFNEALQRQTATSRAAFLDEVCCGQPALRREVESLLCAHERAGRFLERNPLESIYTEKAPVHEGPGTMIGSYKLLEQIGEGGFGIVYMAEQEKPLRRRVALKIIKPGMDTRQVVARFEAERQALALMEHPNIAQVFDGGETASGRPYFVMELVRGIPITDYCNQNQVHINERLGLIKSVCNAVQHAHQKGIIHRDLKPSNIMVTMYNGSPVVKIIDFGIAKSTDQQLTNKTLFTNFAQMIGTPVYMSPEQVQMSGQDIDTRSDIYSLGVVLYELLTGMTPFDQDLLQTAGYDEFRRIIREEEPVRPSSHISTVAKASTTLFAMRKNNEAQPCRMFRAELDWIVMKCLDKDRDRRYESASSLALDIERYLEDEPLHACPPSRWYRLRKYSRRHKAGLTIIAAIFSFIVLLAGIIGWMVRDLNARRSNTAVAVQSAIDEAYAFQKLSKWREGEAAAKRAEALLASGDGSKKMQKSVHDLLVDLRLCSRFEEIRMLACALRKDHFDNESEDSGYASAFHDYGIDVEALDLREAAERIGARAIRLELTAALDAWAKVRRRVPKNGRKHWQDLLNLANVIDTDPNRSLLRKAVLQGDRQAIIQRAANENIVTSSPGTLVLLAGYLEDLGAQHESIALLQRAKDRHPDDFWINHQLAGYLASTIPPQWDEAIRFYTVAVSLRPDSPGANLNLSVTLSRKGRLEEAIAAVRRAIELKPDYAEAHNNLGIDLSTLGRTNEAISCFHQALEIKPTFAEAHVNLGMVLQKMGRNVEAIASYRRAIGLQPGLAECHNGLGHALINIGQFEEAFASIHKAIELSPDLAEAHNNLGFAYYRKGLFDDAIISYHKAIKLKPDLAGARFNLGLAFAGKNRIDEALTAYRQAVVLKPDFAEAHNNIGTALLSMGRHDEAIEALREAVKLKPELVIAHHNLGAVLTRKSRYAEAAETYQRIINLTPNDPFAHYHLGNALSDQCKYVEAVVAYRRSITLKPDYAETHCNLATVLQFRGEFRQALEELKRGHELGTMRTNWPYPSARWLVDCQRMCELEDRLPAFLHGEMQPMTSEERKGLAQLCYYKMRYVTATRVWIDAFHADPQLEGNLEGSFRYQAACAAFLAGNGLGIEANQIDDQKRLHLRKQALDWLHADLVLNSKMLTSSRLEDRQQSLERLRHWQYDSDLAKLHDPVELSKMSVAERVRCQGLWSELEALVTKAETAEQAHQRTR